MEEFIVKFQNLDGVLLKEKKKSFHNLLKNIETSPEIIDDVIKNLKPSTYLEETFKIEFLIYFKRTDNLLEILKNGEEISACKIIRQSWFVKDLMEKISSKEFVEDLLPKLSLCIRTKILKKILIFIKNENKIDELFGEISKMYGSNVAIILLPGLSTVKIKEYLENNFITLSVSQLKVLFDKDKSIILTYFDILKRDNKPLDDYSWYSFYQYVGVKDPLFYLEIAEKYKIYKRRLGRQSTKKIVESQREKILEKPDDFRFLKDDALVRKLGADFPKFYKNALPKNLSNFRYSYAKTLLKYYVKNKQYELFFNTFQELYSKNLWENTEYMDERLIEFIADKDERDKWIAKFENRININKYQIKKRKKCVMMSARCMDFEDDDMAFGENAIKERKTIFNTLISTCKLTKDYDAFLNILKSFCERHRNSDVTILYNFLRTIHKELDMKLLTQEHWKYIHEIITIQLFKKQQIFYPMFVEYIKFQYLHNAPVELLIRTLLNEIPKNMSDFEYDNDEFQKLMLETYLKLLPEIKDEKNILAIQIALSVIKWNKKHPKDIICISNQKSILDIIANLKDTEKIDSNTLKIFKYLICTQDGNEKSELDEIYWSNFKNLNNKTINTWFIKYKPKIIQEHLDKVGIILKDKNINLVNILRKYDHLNIPSAITALCLEELENCEVSKRARVVRILVFFMDRKNLESYFKQFIPTVDKMDVTAGDDNAQKMYEIQCALGKYIKLTFNLKSFLPDLLKYCRGDVLGSALPSLYSSFCRIPSKDLYYALEDLRSKAVSVRKHTIFLSSLILPQNEVLTKYKQINEEKNATVKQYMFISCYKYFLKNQHPECWPIIQSYIPQIKKEQKQTLKLLTKVNKIPNKYRAAFTELAWNTLEKMKKEEVKLSEEMENLLGNIEKNDINNLSPQFCTNIIKKLFDLDECSLIDSVSGFVKKYLLFSNSQDTITEVFKILHEFKSKFWNNDDKKIEALKIVHKFCFYILEDMLEKDMDRFDKNFPKSFQKAWNAEFQMEETFEENLLIDFVVFRYESGIKTESLVQQIDKTFNVVLKQYGNLIIGSFKNFLSSMLRLVLKDDNFSLELIKFLDNFVENNSSVENCILVIELLPTGNYLDEDAQEAYTKLVEKLSKMEKMVKIYLFGKLKSVNY